MNDVDKIGRTALCYAAHDGNAEVTKWLVERGADVNATRVPETIRILR